MREVGRIVIIFGVITTVIGFILFVVPKNKLPFLGGLPGDISVHKNNFSFYFPITTCIVLSVIFSLVIYIFSKK